jgi:flagellar biosynthesis protein FlhG
MTTALPHIAYSAPRPSTGNIIAIASGKGGVGKTWFAITLAHALSRRGRRPLLFDGDLGLANVDIQLGLMPHHDLGGVLAGRLSLAQATLAYETGGFDIVAGRSGCGRLASVPEARLAALDVELAHAAGHYDHVILDLGAGVERTVRRLTRLAGSCIVVVTDEPTSLTDAYAFIKVAQIDSTPAQLPTRMQVVVNLANSARHGERTYSSLFRACSSFLKVSPQLLGVIRRDTRVRAAIRSQTPLLTRFPTSDAALDVEAIATAIVAAAA